MEEHQVCHASSMVSMDLHIPMKATVINLAIHFNLHHFLTLISISLPVPAPAAAAGDQVAELTSSLVAKQFEKGNSNNMALLQKLGASSRLLRSAPSQLTWRRNMADAHGPAKVPIWQDPTSPSKWKEEHFVFVSLAGWGALFYGCYKFFTSGPSKGGAGGDKKGEPCPPGMERVRKH